MLNKGWAVAVGLFPLPFSQSLFSALYLLLSWAWLWSGFSFWKWQVISQYVFTICIRLSKEATNGLCHGTVSARFLGTSSDAERGERQGIQSAANVWHHHSQFSAGHRAGLRLLWRSPLLVLLSPEPCLVPWVSRGAKGMSRGSKWLHFASSWHRCCCSKGEFLKPFFSSQTGFLHTPSKLLHIFQIEIFRCKASSLADC